MSASAPRARGEALLLSVRAAEPWQGRVRFDGPRHRETMHLQSDYPRLNAWPEWFVVERDASYEIEDVASRVRSRHLGAELRRGLLVDLAAGRSVHLRVRPLSPAGG